MLKKFEMEELKPINTPMSSSVKLDKDKQGTSVDVTKYRGRKLDFSYIMLQHMNSVLNGTRPKALHYGMILTKVFEHFGISVHDSVALLPKPTDTINISTLKRPYTLSFEGGEEMDEDEDETPPRPRSNRLMSSTSDFTFTEDHYNLH
ncbi:Uncharacterized protein Adt_05941 [Abeliophyllum distichum]|uniref:Uncharacterized protein n=1 Tax=Abeliophyllum distichum TaxID=126358 RepID=A0ABD1V5H9_9LAMI